MACLTKKQFRLIASIAKDHWGLNITDQKYDLIKNRMAKHMNCGRFSDVDEYLDYIVECSSDAEKLELFDVLSTNVTSFFREAHHYDYIERELYTPLRKHAISKPGSKIRIWSAGCSFGCEPYSMAMHADVHLGGIDNWDIEILATDLSNSALSVAQRAVYDKSSMANIDVDMYMKYFIQKNHSDGEKYMVNDRIRKIVHLARLNLIELWPFKGPLDIIFCRNVMIYFDKKTKTEIINRMYDMMCPGGIFAIGSSETLSGIDVPFRSAAPSLYIK